METITMETITMENTETMTLIAHPDIIDAIRSMIDDGDSLLTDILCDSYDHIDRDNASDLVSSVTYEIL